MRTDRTLFLLTCLAVCLQAAAGSFATQRLDRLAGYLSLQQLDGLPQGITGTYAYRQHPLVVRKNQWGEVEHIGLLLFAQAMRQANPSPIYDFLERYLLARMVTPASSEDGTKMQWDDVHFVVGTPQTALAIDTLTAFAEERVDLRVYRVTWSATDGRPLLTVSFKMDYQLLTGCDAVELEHNFIRSLRRYQPTAAKPVASGPTAAVPPPSALPSTGTEHTLVGSYFISPMVRNDLYFTRDKEQQPWTLVSGKARATKTIANWMLSAEADNELPMDLAVDKYGYLVDSLKTTYRAWQQLCMGEGCQPFYGLKGKQGATYQGSVFMVNRRGGYMHLLSVNIPDALFADGKAARMTARFYAYIPLYNVSGEMLKIQDFEPIQ